MSIHPNSREAYHTGQRIFSALEKRVMAALHPDHVATVKQIAQLLGFPHRQDVSPRVTELIGCGALEECGTARDPDNGRPVRLVRITQRGTSSPPAAVSRPALAPRAATAPAPGKQLEMTI